MSEKQHAPAPTAHHGNFTNYLVGFILSIALTLAAYFVVANRLFDNTVALGVIITLAIGQLFVQLFFFLHLGSEAKPRWNLTAFLFMGLVVAIVVFGSIWIMQNLDYNMMPDEAESYMLEQSQKGF